MIRRFTMRLIARLFRGHTERKARLEEERRSVAQVREEMQRKLDKATQTIAFDSTDPAMRAAISGVASPGETE